MSPANQAPLEASYPEITPAPLPRFTAPHIVAALALAILVCVLYLRISFGMSINPAGDSAAHVKFAEEWSRTGVIPTPHFLYQALIVRVYRLGLAHSVIGAAMIVLGAFYILTAWLLYALFFRAFHGHPRLGRPWALAAIAMVTLLAQPLYFEQGYNIGYFWPTQHDNPTSVLAKPLSIVVFLCAAWCLSHRGRLGFALCALSAAAAIAGTLAKPSFVICFLPAVGLIALIRLLRRQEVSLNWLLGCTVAPIALALGWQFYQTFAGHPAAVQYTDSIIWAPLVVMRMYSTNLVLKFILSCAFPLAVTALYWQRARRDMPLLLAWTTFLTGALYAYTLAEKTHITAGNFLWSPYAALFVLFIASILFWLPQDPAPRDWRYPFCGALLTLHAASGALILWRYWNFFRFTPYFQ